MESKRLLTENPDLQDPEGWIDPWPSVFLGFVKWRNGWPSQVFAKVTDLPLFGFPRFR